MYSKYAAVIDNIYSGTDTLTIAAAQSKIGRAPRQPNSIASTTDVPEACDISNPTASSIRAPEDEAGNEVSETSETSALRQATADSIEVKKNGVPEACDINNPAACMPRAPETKTDISILDTAATRQPTADSTESGSGAPAETILQLAMQEAGKVAVVMVSRPSCAACQFVKPRFLELQRQYSVSNCCLHDCTMYYY